MAYGLRITPHSRRPGIEVVEIMDGEDVVGTIVPEEDGIKIITVHADGVEYPEQLEGQVLIDDGESSIPPIPAVYVKFKPGPWTIVDGRVVKLA